MPRVLLPNTASPYLPRSPTQVVLNRTVEPWLTEILKNINRTKRRLRSASQHVQFLTEILSSTAALWNLCTLAVSKAPKIQLVKDPNPLIEALNNTKLLHVHAYVVYVDLVSNQISFKLSPDTIQELIKYHKDVYLVDQDMSTWQWAQKYSQIKKLHEEFVLAVHEFIIITNADSLEGIDDDGAGELLCGRSDAVKSAVMGLFCPLLSPALPSYIPIHPVDPWKVIPSQPLFPSQPDTTLLDPWPSQPPFPQLLPLPSLYSWTLGTTISPIYQSLPLPSLILHRNIQMKTKPKAK